jgi:hypothetical protein
MKRTILLVTLSAALAAMAQQQPQSSGASAPEIKRTNITTQRRQAPTYTDLNCSGFITNQPPQKLGYVAGGWGTPHQTRFVDRNYVYLAGSGFTEGAEYSIVRELRDPNHYEVFRGQHALLRQLGHPYADIARVKVVYVKGNIAATQVEHNCSDVLTGDEAIPYVEKPKIDYRAKTTFDRFAPPNGKLTGRIVMSKDFDSLAGTGHKVYLNVGSNQGVKVGDYFRAVRTYDSIRYDEVENISFNATYYDETQVAAGYFPRTRLNEFPRMSLGEMIVLGVTPSSSTAMVTFSLEDIHLGDGVELEDAPPAVEEQAKSSQAAPSTAPAAGNASEALTVTPAAAPQPPTIACSANPATVHAGETAVVSCEASSPDNRPVSVAFSSPHGHLVPSGNTAVLDTRDSDPGPVEVMATASDDRNLSASAKTTVDVTARAPAPVPARLNTVSFKRNSAYVNNSAKAALDGIALRMQRDSDSSLVVMGLVESGEPASLADRRAEATADYLSKSKGIDIKRLQLRNGGQYGEKAELWIVPPGTRLEDAKLQH